MSTEPPAMSVAESSAEPLDEQARGSVRFDTQCVVIPDPTHRSRRPRVTTKSYALPLWKRRASYSGPSSSTSLEPETVSSDENQLFLRVPLPTLSLKPQSSRSTDNTPLAPCLVHRTPAPSPGSPMPRSSSLSRRAPRKSSPSRSDIVTVPLRPCCATCQTAAEAALVDGDAWPEHFSRGASKRRSLSADSGPRTAMGSAVAAFYAGLGHPITINVDEVDKRRRSSDIGPPRPSQEWVWLNDSTAKDDPAVGPSLQVSRNGISNPSASPPSPTRLTPSTPRIPEEDPEEDEDELFPLPSPRRTPTPSPAPSPAGSLSSLSVPQANQNSTGSPTPSSGSTESTKVQLLAPPGASSSSLSLPKMSESTTDLTMNELPPRSSSPNVLSSLPSISGREVARSPSPRISRTPPTPTELSPIDPPQIPRLPSPINIPSSGSRLHPRVPSSPQTSPTQSRFSWRTRRSISTDASIPSSPPPSFSPSTSPDLSTSLNTKKRSSFALASPRHIFADMLRGVGAIGSGSGGIAIGR